MRTRAQMIEDRNYYNDPRVQAQMVTRPWSVVPVNDEKDGVVVIRLADTLYDDLLEQSLLHFLSSYKVRSYDDEDEDGEEKTPLFQVQAHFEVCPLCRGRGSVVNPSIDCGGLTDEDFYDDEDFAEMYHRGQFNQKCPECDGLRVVAIPTFPDGVDAVINEWMRAEADFAAEQAAELAFGC